MSTETNADRWVRECKHKAALIRKHTKPKSLFGDLTKLEAKLEDELKRLRAGGAL